VFSPPLLSLCGSIFSRISMIMASWIRGLADADIYLYLHTMSQTDRGPGFAVSNTYVPCSVIYILHPKNFSDLQFILLLVRTHQGFENIGINKRTIDVVL
jgi:hypothetical protein